MLEQSGVDNGRIDEGKVEEKAKEEIVKCYNVIYNDKYPEGKSVKEKKRIERIPEERLCYSEERIMLKSSKYEINISK